MRDERCKMKGARVKDNGGRWKMKTGQLKDVG